MRPVHLIALLVLALAPSLPSQAVAQSRFFTFERNVDRFGNDFNSTLSESAEACSFACQLLNQCRAWTFVRASGRCFFKNPAPRASRNTCCTSGVRKGGGVIID
jgi:PAN domain-containing protein